MHMQSWTEIQKDCQHMEYLTTTTLGGAFNDSHFCLARDMLKSGTCSWHCEQSRTELAEHLQPLETERLPEACPRKPQGLQISYLHAHSAMRSAHNKNFFLKPEEEPL